MEYRYLNRDKAWLWRIVHRDNLPWILSNGLHCGNSKKYSPSWISIGNQELIDKRADHMVPQPPGGVLNDYVPFYFTSFSVMMYNIHSDWGGVQQRLNEEIVILVSSMRHIHQQGLRFLFTDRHAYSRGANFYQDLADLDKIDWPLLQRRDFIHDPDDPAKFERYQAECLVHQYCPISGLLGIGCYTDELKLQLEQLINEHGLSLSVRANKGWYF